MRDVAALAGVSLKTVSRVVNDEPGVSAGAFWIQACAADEDGDHRNERSALEEG